ncbi:unnamed protein product [Brachionus calyciflorus]|uniref:Integrase catalytic domain-containing protein n=1 Tax=Brachionus calyciflorus TaxID=104777 RepID=A0A813YDH9_9BILA|nr:unnamed protein product [Brachionus calyciflorus]
MRNYLETLKRNPEQMASSSFSITGLNIKSALVTKQCECVIGNVNMNTNSWYNNHRFIFADVAEDGILGIDFQMKFDAVFDYKHRRVTIKQDKNDVHLNYINKNENKKEPKDFNNPFELFCDASATHVGAVYAQRINGVAHPVGFASRKLTKKERNYSANHKPVNTLVKAKEPKGRLYRLMLKLQELDYEIIYYPGKLNFTADQLSRPPTETSNVEVKDEDYECLKFKEFWKKVREKLIVKNGIFYKTSDSESLIVVPTGHLSYDRTLQSIANKYVWQEMRANVFDYCSSSDKCQKFKIKNTSNIKTLITIRVDKPWDLIKKLRTTPYHRQCNGLTERTIRTIKQMLYMYVNYSHDNWEKCLQSVIFAYNNTRHLTTNVAPNVIVFGKLMISSVDKLCVIDRSSVNKDENFVEKIQDKMRKSQENQKRQYDSKVRDQIKFNIGDLVVLVNTRQRPVNETLADLIDELTEENQVKTSTTRNIYQIESIYESRLNKNLSESQLEASSEESEKSEDEQVANVVTAEMDLS